MKKLLIVLLLVPSVSFAWTVPGNPDYVPSLGFLVSHQNLTGNRNEIDLPNNPLELVHKGSDKSTLDKLGVDFRLPLRSNCTVGLFYNELTASENFTREQNSYQELSTLNGYEVGFTARLYFNR